MFQKKKALPEAMHRARARRPAPSARRPCPLMCAQDHRSGSRPVLFNNINAFCRNNFRSGWLGDRFNAKPGKPHMRVAIVGAGYVGLTTGACLTLLGHHVSCHDTDPVRLGQLKRGRIPIYEPRLDDIVAQSMGQGRLAFSDDMAGTVSNARIVFLTVGTPSLADGDIDLSHLEEAARQLAPHLQPLTKVVIKSTVSVGTSRQIAQIIRGARGRDDIAVAVNPEFLREGSAVDDFLNPDRIVIGSDCPDALRALKALYQPLLERSETRLLETGPEDAELVKHGANAFLAMKLAFINDVADLCERTGANIDAVAQGIGLDERIGPHFLRAGPGFGGSCFPKDTRAFAAAGRRTGARQTLVEDVARNNDRRKEAMARRILSQGELAPGDTVAILGVAFKGETDDVRESPALTVIPLLQAYGCRIRAHDPRAMGTAGALLGNVQWCRDAVTAAEGANALVILTDWQEFLDVDFGRIASAMTGRAVFDMRNMLDPEAVAAHGLDCFGIGRPAVRAPRLLTRTLRKAG